MKRLRLYITLLFFIFLLTINCKNKESIASKPTDYDGITIADPFEQMPVFPGGEKQLSCFLDKNLNKEKLKSFKLSGIAIAQFLVDSTGEVKDIKILKKLDPTVDSEFVRVLKLMPNWEPGRLSGKPNAVRFNLPLRIPYENRFCKEQ